MRRIALQFAVLALIVCACAARAEDEDAKKMEGSWTIESVTSKGEKQPAEQLKDITMVITGNKMQMKLKDEAVSTVTFKLDGEQKPKHIDLTHVDGDQKDKVELGIYELDGDTLKLTSSDPGEKRPEAFESAAGSKIDFLVLKRKK
ncbi:MAG TPA: TIGR03067 domain-containing protein [Planctomycetota bacterium]|nr:TIGR03067 domain-containing protein [Planctomycetota bacterium]